MPPALSDTQFDIVKTTLTGKFDQGKIADAAGCSICQVKRIKKNIRTFGTAKTPKLKVQGRPRVVTRVVTREAVEVLSLFFHLNDYNL